jgi:3-oxoacyl-[acyl-carrier protein] reductase
MELEGKVVVITGAGRGIGRASALLLAKHGATIVAVARTRSDLDSLVAEIEAQGGRAVARTVDVSDRDQAEQLICGAAAELGRLDILINNAGNNIRSPIDQVTDEQWREIVGSNLDSTFYCTRAVAPIMMQQRSGKIINLSSVAVWHPTATRTVYGAVKHGVIGFSRALALDLKDYDVTVSTVSPGPTATDLRKRAAPDEDQSTIMRPEDVAEAILFLATRPPRVIIPEITIQPRVSL